MRKILFLLAFVLIFGAFAQVSIIVDSYQGYHGGSDCSVCHNEPATAWNETFSASECVPDGIADEDFWQEPATDFHTQYIPVAGSYGSNHMFVRVVFSQNATHLFLKMDWEDLTLNGTDDKKFDDADGVSIYWNTDGALYDGGFPDGMKTLNGTLDVWTWKAATTVEDIPSGTINVTETVAPVETSIESDFVMNTIGLATDGNQDVKVGATYGNQGSHHEDSYMVEMVRALETGDESDIQFSESGYYTFGLALFKENSGDDHLMGFEHQIWIYNGVPETPVEAENADSPVLGIVVSVIAMTTMIAMVRKRE